MKKSGRRMNTNVCLLRGINVSGHKIIRMQELRELCGSIGFENVESYLQSGNLVFDSPEGVATSVASSVHNAIMERFGFDVPTIIRSKDEFAEVIDGNPFVGLDGIDETKLCVVFLAEEPSPEALQRIESENRGPDRFAAVGLHIYLHCPSGFGRTKLSNNFFENRLRVVATARNWRTVNALFDMLGKR